MPTRIGLLGAGRIGHAHARAIAEIDSAELAAVFDPVDAAAQAIIDLSGAKRATVEDIFADSAIDAVIIATPTDLHAQQDAALRSMQEGKAIRL